MAIKKILIALLLVSSFVMPQSPLVHKIAKAKTNFVTVPPTSLVNEPNCVFSYSGNKPINKLIVDESGNGNNGSLNGGVVYAGGLEGGLQFDGVNDYVSVADADNLTLGNSSLTISATIKPSLLNAGGIIEKLSGALTGEYVMRISDAAGGITVILFDNGGSTNYSVFTAPSSTLSVGKNYDINFTYSSGTGQFYVNGISITTTKTNTGTGFSQFANTSQIVKSGFCAYASAYFNGTIYSVKLYNVALTAQQVKDKWNKIANKPYILEDFSDGTVGKFPRDWTKISGTHTIQQTTADEGIVKKGTKYLRTDVAGIVAFPSNQAYGRWSFDVYKGGASNVVNIYPLQTTNNIYTSGTGYFLQIYADENLFYYKFASGLPAPILASSASYISNNTWYHIDIERTTAGVFSVYITGGAFTTKTLVSTVGGSGSNPVLDRTYTTSKFFVLDLDSGDRFSNLRMYKSIPVN